MRLLIRPFYENFNELFPHRKTLKGLENNQWSFVIYLYNPLFFLGSILLVIGILVAIRTDSCVTAWLGIEVNLVGLIGVFAVRESLSATVKIKYFVVQCLASSLFLIGILRIKRGEIGHAGNLVLFSNAIVQLGLFIKIGIFPVHTWVPSVVNSSDWFVV